MQTKTSRSVLNILKDNVFTLFNVLLCVVAFFVLLTGSWQNCLFIIIIFVNSGIGIVTELKAKRTLDKLSLTIQEKYTVLRGSVALKEVLAEQIIVGDIIELSAGMQVPVDGETLGGNIAVNESMLTGESKNIAKNVGDAVKGGTLVVVGGGRIVALATAQDSYIASLSSSAKQFKIAPSDLRDGTNKILKYISVAILPISLMLILTHLLVFQDGSLTIQSDDWRGSILATAGGIIGMIPEGLVLLTSLNFAIAVIMLARKDVLVTELNSVETLARVDEIILDKTGTITDGTVYVNNILSITQDIETIITPENANHADLWALREICRLPGGTTTSDAILHKLDGEFAGIFGENESSPQVLQTFEFDAAKKYSAILFRYNEKNFLYKMGAPEYVYPGLDTSKWTENGDRVLVTTISELPAKNTQESADFTASDTIFDTTQGKLVYTITCSENIRESAKPIIEYFMQSGINVQVVSGDNEVTVRNIAGKLGITQVIGRALPETKLEIVRQLQSQGKVVAMTGDGVNDILALKEADLGIAMGNASAASKAVANIVLIDSNFANLPYVMGQGRRVIANIERVASLFLVKTFYSIGLALTTVIFSSHYPFLPIHLTLISALFIGIPAFFLALPANNTLYRKGFLRRVLKFSLPFSVVVIVAVTISTVFFDASASVNLSILAAISFVVLLVRSKPLFSWRGLMLLLLVVAFVLVINVPVLATLFLVQ